MHFSVCCTYLTLLKTLKNMDYLKFMIKSKYLRDSVPGKYRDLEVNIVTRVDRIDITPLIIEISIFEDLKCPFLKGELIFADNSGLMTALPIVGQEEVEIKFTRAGHSVEKVFACTSVVNIEKVAGEVAGVVMTLTSKKHLTNAVKQFSKAFTRPLQCLYGTFTKPSKGFFKTMPLKNI